MIEKNVSFYSEGKLLQGMLYFPDRMEPGKKYAALLPCSGYNGFNAFYPKLFARSFTEQGFICLGFDYRGFGGSEGEAGRVILDEQADDARNAITFLGHQQEVDPHKIGILGWGMGASHAIRVAAADRRVKAVAGINGFYNGERWLKAVHGYAGWCRILQAVAEDRIQRVLKGKSNVVDSFHHYPLDPITDRHVQVELSGIEGFGRETNIQFTDSMIGMNAEAVIKNISPRSLLIAHGARNMLHPVDESVAAFQAADEPKEYYEIDGEHNDFMYHDHAEYRKLIRALVQFFHKNLHGPRTDVGVFP